MRRRITADNVITPTASHHPATELAWRAGDSGAEEFIARFMMDWTKPFLKEL
jgi:hypothetical protein